MKKLTVMICMVVLSLAVVAGPSIAKGPGSGKGKGKSKGYAAKQWRGTIKPTVAGGTVKGSVKADQNKKFTQLKVHLRGLTPGGAYTITLNTTACQSTTPTGATGSTDIAAAEVTGPTGDGSDTAAVTKTVTANSAGHANKNTKVKRSTLTLLTSGEYSVQVADSTGAVVGCGDLVAKKKKK